MIKVGDKLPQSTFKVMTESGPGDKTTDDVFSGRKIALFAVPGAFTPTCHKNHLPGFLANAGALKAKGIDAIVCVSVNDVHVMNAWAKATAADGKIEFLADGAADFTKKVGLEFEGPMGVRSKRYAMLVDDGVVKVLNVEDVTGKAEASSAEALLAQI